MRPGKSSLPAVAVARIDGLGAHDPADAVRLQPRDRTRFEGMGSAKRRRELLAGRRLLAELAASLDLAVAFDGAEAAAGVVVDAGSTGSVALSASVTHSGPWVACAIGDADGIGIDLEVLAERDFLALSEAAFPGSAASLSALASSDRAMEFYRRWTRHEAAVKCGTRQDRHQASWGLPDHWILSLNWSSGCGPAAEPLLWDDRARGFIRLHLEPLEAPGRLRFA